MNADSKQLFWRSCGFFLTSIVPAIALLGGTSALASSRPLSSLANSNWLSSAPGSETSERLLGSGDTQSRLAQLPGTDGASPSREELPEPLPPGALPAPADLLGPSFSPSEAPTPEQPGVSTAITVERFEVLDSTVFSDPELQRTIQQALEAEGIDLADPITFEDVLKVRDAVSDLYRDAGFITSGAIVPPQSVEAGVVQIQTVEGRVEDIIVEDTVRLHPGYVRSRLNVATGAPLNVNRLLEQLQLLRLDPVIENIAADLQAGTRPGTNLLVVSIIEADTFDITYTLDNNRSPSVGSIRNRAQLQERNLTGLGDTLTLSYSTTGGSRDFDLGYRLPINPYNGTLGISLGDTRSDVIEDPFEVLDVTSDAAVAEITLRQPLIQTPTQEFALGLVGSRQGTQTFLGIADIGGFPLSAGADDEGRTAVTAIRFFQEWTRRSPEQVIALRSQFNFGIGALGATVNNGDMPDSRFFSWLGQGQWVRRLGEDTLLVTKGSVQLTPDPLLSLERYGLGGQANVRGYRQDALLTDNGAAFSIEGRIPVWRDLENDGLLQITPFLEGGYGWNTVEADPEDKTLLGTGVGMLLQVEKLNLRIDYGIPLINSRDDRDTLQERGVYFSLGYSFL
ncbi:MAG: ShlB/FhaC/HecB family hemolysin secretion/activation protein [Cyanobacteria bacterium J06638_28]